MAVNTPLRYINDGEPLDEVVLNRSNLDTLANLENLFSRVDGYDGGTPDAESDRVVLRDNNATAKFGVPSEDQHPWRLNEFREYMFEYFEESDRSNTDPLKILNYDHLPKATATTPGITQLINSYTSSDGDNAPTAEALGDLYRWLATGGDPVGQVHRDRLPSSSTTSSGILQMIDSYQSDSLTKSPTANALYQLYLLMESGLQSVQDDMPESLDVFSWDQIKNNNPSVGDYGLNNEKDFVSSGYAARRLYEELEDFIKQFTTQGTGWNITERSGAFRLPNGLILQAGVHGTGADGKRLLEMPIAFPNGLWCCVASEWSASWWINYNGNPVVPTVYGMDFSSSTLNGVGDKVLRPNIFSARLNTSGATLAAYTGFSWIALGH